MSFKGADAAIEKTIGSKLYKMNPDVKTREALFGKSTEKEMNADTGPDQVAVPVAPENDPAQRAEVDEEARKARMRAGRGSYDTLATAGGYAGDTSKATTAAKTLLGT